MEGQARKYEGRAREVRLAFNNKFYDPLTGTYAKGSQTAMSMPLVLGLVDESEREKVFSNLVDSIRAVRLQAAG